MSDSATLDLAYPRGLWSDWLCRPRAPRLPSTPKPRTQHRIPWRGKRMSIRRPLKLLIRVSARENCGFCPACLAQEILGEHADPRGFKDWHDYCTAPADGQEGA